ncbi:hypothetical protein GCM10011367_14500 [Marinicauda pacifica]|nr:hypothetical protein GCM10011367_14500 [Marinicauda pacifica]
MDPVGRRDDLEAQAVGIVVVATYEIIVFHDQGHHTALRHASALLSLALFCEGSGDSAKGQDRQRGPDGKSHDDGLPWQLVLQAQ